MRCRSAQKLCKPEKIIEASTVSRHLPNLFHKLINTCVENFTCRKYSLRNSAWHVLRCGFPRF